MHKEWKSNLLGNDINDEGYPFVQIEESEIIDNNEKCIIDHKLKNARVFCVLNNRTKDISFKIFTHNVATDNPINLKRANIDESELLSTRVYSKFFRAYQERAFKEKGFLLKK